MTVTIPDWTEATYKEAYIRTLQHIVVESNTLDQLRWIALNRLYTQAKQDGDEAAMAKYDAERMQQAERMKA